MKQTKKAAARAGMGMPHLDKWQILALIIIVGLAGAYATFHSFASSRNYCLVTPAPLVSGGPLTVSGTAGKNGDSLSVYVHYADSSQWTLFGGKASSGGNFAFSGTAVTGDQSWGTVASGSPAPSGAGYVDVYAASPAKASNTVTAHCTFSVQ